MNYPVTPDGRYFVVGGRLWRTSNPALLPETRAHLTGLLMQARRDKGKALRAGDDEAREEARQRVDAAKQALGERGPVWWTDGAPDWNRRMVRNTPYAGWFQSLQAEMAKGSGVGSKRLDVTAAGKGRGRRAGAETTVGAVEEYLAGLPAEAREVLKRVREAIRKASPKGAVEVISYAIPAFALHGTDGKVRPYFGYAAFKKHYSLLPFSGSFLSGLPPELTEELVRYRSTKGSLHLLYEQAVPAALIRRLVKERVAGLKA